MNTIQYKDIPYTLDGRTLTRLERRALYRQALEYERRQERVILTASVLFMLAVPIICLL